MKVRALVSFVSPSGSASAGEVLDVPEAQASDWVRANLVELIRDAGVEEAVRSAPEAAVTRRRRFS